MSTFGNVMVFVAILMVLILLHEMGHMIVAKMCGMRVERFSIFFGRPLWSFRRGETEYGIGWIPLGGFVSITGMTRESLVERETVTVPGDDARALEVQREEDRAHEERRRIEPTIDGWFRQGRRRPGGEVTLARDVPMRPELAARAYCNSTTPRKVATILAGPAANVLVAIVAFAVAFWIGTPEYRLDGTLRAVTDGGPAAQAGLVAGDRITSINGVTIAEPPADVEASVERMREEIQGNVGNPVTVTFDREGTPKTVTTPPLAPAEDDASIGRLGVSFDQVKVGTVRDGPLEGAWNAITFSAYLTKEQVIALGQIFTEKEVREQVQGPIGIGATYNEFAEEGLSVILRFVGIISLILAIMNLIPLLPLDGGHIVFALAERIRGRALSIAVYQRASVIGIGFILILAVYAFNNDIGRLTGEGFNR